MTNSLWGVLLALLLAAASGSVQAQEYGYDPSPLATSQPFDLQSPVEGASFNLRQTSLQLLYDAIAGAYQITLVFDRDLPSRPVAGTFRIEDATLQEALEAAASISGTFVAPLDPRSGIVAADTPQKRAEYERQILGSFHVDDQLTPQQLTEISNALRNIVDLRRVTQDSKTNWITVLGRSRQVSVAQQFVRTLNRGLGEIMLEIHVWEVSSRRARQLGFLPPQPFALRFLGSSENPTVPLSQLSSLSRFYGVQLAGLTALLNSSSSLVRSHQVFRLRASDGQEARLLSGERIPVITSTVSSAIEAEDSEADLVPGAGEGFIPGLEYQDVGVVVQATPHLHAGRELTLQLDFALRSLGPTGENGLPSFSNRQLTSQIRLQEGEGYLLGGILTNSKDSARSGYPLLAHIPFLGHLFSSSTRQSEETELLILVKPLSVRAPAAAEFASRSIYFGRELSGLPAAVAPPPTEQPEGQPVQPVQPGAPQPPGVAPVPGQPVQVPGQVPQPGVPGQPGVFPPGVFPQGVPQPPGIVPGQQQQQPGEQPQETPEAIP